MLSREEILATTLKVVEVEVPEWGGTVRLQELTADDAISLQEEMKGIQDTGTTGGVRELAIVLCAVGEDGERLFTVDDMPELRKKSNEAINRLGAAAWDLVGLGDTAIEEAAEN
jgi:hypothetical protein